MMLTDLKTAPTSQLSSIRIHYHLKHRFHNLKLIPKSKLKSKSVLKLLFSKELNLSCE